MQFIRMNVKKTQQNVFPYGVVEAALAEVLNIERERMKAFRARLLHLRNLGVPSVLPRPGSGRKIAYSLRQVLEMLFVLVLEDGGFTPRGAKAIGPKMMRAFEEERSRRALEGLAEEDIYFSTVTRTAVGWGPITKIIEIEPSSGYGFVTCVGFGELTHYLENELKQSNSSFLINASVLVAKMEKALTKVLLA
jgi:hypothetical protein